MILWETPVLDRSQADVDYAKTLWDIGYSNLTDTQKAEYIAGLKGSLNTSDLLRIENNIQLLSDVLELNLTTYNGNIPGIPNVAYYDNLISNVEAIRSAYTTYDNTPATPSGPINEFSKINNIEQIVTDVYKILNSNFHYYTGQGLYSGRRIGLL